MGAHAKVLVLEDEWLIADQIESALIAAGYDVVGPVGRVRQAMDLLNATSVDAAVLDVNLHEDRSFAVADRLVKSATPLVFLSGYSDLEIPKRLTGRRLMQKPVDADDLCKVLGELLA